jgi:excisionase family DNA binding protein
MTAPLRPGRQTVALVPRLALSPREAAASLGVSTDYLHEHIAHELRWVRRGRRRLVAVAEIERWLSGASALAVGEERRRA